MTRIYLLLFLLSYNISLISAQKRAKTDELEQYFNDARRGESFYIPQNALKEYNPDKLLKFATPFLKDEKTFVRYKAIDLIKRKGLLVTDTVKRRQYTRTLIIACKDKDSGNSGVASAGLTLFLRNDFDKTAKDSIASLLRQKPYHHERLIQIAGFLEIEEARKLLLLNIAADTIYNTHERWAANLALARMGDSTSIEYCLSRIRSVPVNDKVIYALYPDLLYTRQPKAIQYMLEGIMDDTKKCTSPNPNNEAPIICAFKIIELVGPVIENFPLKADNQGEIEIENYDEALVAVREWIKGKTEVRVKREEY